jgi:hypothetical protein
MDPMTDGVAGGAQVFSVELDYTDPVTPGNEASESERAAHAARVNSYAEKERKYHEAADELPINFWYDLTADFRPENLNWPSTLEAKAWRDLIDKKGVRIARGRGIKIVDAIRDVTTAVEFPGYKDTAEEARPNLGEAQNPGLLAQLGSRGDESENKDQNLQSLGGTDSSHGRRTPSGQLNDGSSSADLNSFNMVQLSKLLVGRERYGGTLGEDLQSALGTYEAIASVAQCSEKEMSAGLILYLKSDALGYYIESIKGIHIWEQVSKMMRDKFTSEEQRARCLTEWQDMSLSM